MIVSRSYLVLLCLVGCSPTVGGSRWGWPEDDEDDLEDWGEDEDGWKSKDEDMVRNEDNDNDDSKDDGGDDHDDGDDNDDQIHEALDNDPVSARWLCHHPCNHGKAKMQQFSENSYQ